MWTLFSFLKNPTIKVFAGQKRNLYGAGVGGGHQEDMTTGDHELDLGNHKLLTYPLYLEGASWVHRFHLPSFSQRLPQGHSIVIVMWLVLRPSGRYM